MKSVTENIEQSLIENQRFIEAMESHAKSKNRNLFDLPPVSMEIENGLVRPCEPVTIHLRATAAEIPQGSLTVEADYLGANPDRPEVLLRKARQDEIQLPEELSQIARLTQFGTIFRYDAIQSAAKGERAKWLDQVRSLRVFAEPLIR